MRIRPPEGFDAVYLPTKEFERIVNELKKLGLDVDAYMIEDRELGKRILDTCFNAEKWFDLGDVVAGLVVDGCVSNGSVDIIVEYSGKKWGSGRDVALSESVDFRYAVRRVSEIMQSIKSIVEEHMRKVNHEVLRIREFASKVEGVLLRRGFERTHETSLSYRKAVGRFYISVVCIEENRICGVGIGDFKPEELSHVLDSLEKILAGMGGEGGA